MALADKFKLQKLTIYAFTDVQRSKRAGKFEVFAYKRCVQRR